MNAVRYSRNSLQWRGTFRSLKKDYEHVHKTFEAFAFARDDG